MRTENVTLPEDYVSKAANTIISQLGPVGVEQVGGKQWWQWRPKEGELKAEWIEMRSHYNEQKRKASKSRRIMLYVHGGGYFFGSVDEHRYQMQRHARKLKARVFAPRYRLAPQFPFPCGLQDCLAAYLYLLSIHDATEIILAGDSAGGGMVVSMLCILRDQRLPLPAGAILISPWVDLSHSFPSLNRTDNFDYIPPYGFMQKPSVAWPPPTDEELATITKLAKGEVTSGKLREDDDQTSAIPTSDDGPVKPGPQLPLSIELDGQQVELKDQVQMYATNQMLAHPLVSPVLQPSLGGLPPIMILTGGGEILRDEQIYLAHKMANPSKYPLGAAYKSRYDPDDAILKKYKPTPVQLQVWEDLCHVAPTLSFTRPAKYMYRSIAQFGAWVLAKAQKRAIEIVDDDNISVISSRTDTDSQTDAEAGSSDDSTARAKLDDSRMTGSVGRAGDPIPPFVNNMIRQRIDRYGTIYPLAEPSDLPALQMQPDEVGVIKPGPVRKWQAARNLWDTKYASTRRRVQKERVRALASGKVMGFEAGERPPPSALAGRRSGKDMIMKKRKSYGLAMWSMWGSKHDETTLKREEQATEAEKAQDEPSVAIPQQVGSVDQPVTVDGNTEITRAEEISTTRRHSRQRSSSAKRRTNESLTRGRKRTISVTDQGQTEGRYVPPILPPQHPLPSTGSPDIASSTQFNDDDRAKSPNPSLLSAGFMPKFKTASHLRDEGGGGGHTPVLSDAASTRTGRSGMIPDDASTTAVFAASGVIQSIDGQGKNIRTVSGSARPQSPLANETKSFISNTEDIDETEHTESSTGVQQHVAGSAQGNETPRSQRSLDRLQSHQRDEGMTRLAPMRSASSTAVVRAEGIVGVVDEGVDDKLASSETADTAPKEISTTENEIHKEEESNNAGEPTDIDTGGIAEKNATERPKLYDRSDTEFQTALEKAN